MRVHAVGLLVAMSTVVLASPGAAQPTVTLTPFEIQAACAPPATLDGAPSGALRVAGAQDTMPRTVFATGDLIIVNGGRSRLKAGDRFFVRRANRFGMYRAGHGRGARTLGWIRVVSTNNATAVAAIEQTCSPIAKGDYLQPFAAPRVPSGAERDEAGSDADLSARARIVSGAEERRAMAAGDFALINRGANQGLRLGARVAVVRDTRVKGAPMATVGNAVVVSAGPNVAVARITATRDAVLSGDYVAFRK